MRKFLLIVIVILILLLAFFFIRDGMTIGKVDVLGISGIKGLNKNLDNTLNNAEQLVNVDFDVEYDKLNDSLDKLAAQRQKYETALVQNGDQNISEVLTNEKYEVEKLWVSIGNYADEHNITVNMEIVSSSSGITEMKDLKFTVSGSYVGVTEFIYDLEDDSELEFKIEQFKMLPDGTSGVKSTFIVKDINVNISNVSSSSPTFESEEDIKNNSISEKQNEETNLKNTEE